MTVTLIGQIEGELSSEDVSIRGMVLSVLIASRGEGFWVKAIGCGSWGSVGFGREMVVGLVAAIYMVVVEVVVNTSMSCLLSRSMMTKGFSLQGPMVGMISTNSFVAVNAQVY